MANCVPQIDEFPFVSACDSTYIYQDEDKTKYICHLSNHKSNFNERMVLNRPEVETLELALISAGKWGNLISQFLLLLKKFVQKEQGLN